MVWSIQKVIPEGAIFKLGPNGYMYVSQKPMWKLGALQAEGAIRMRNRDDLSIEYPIYCSFESYIILLSDRRRRKWKSRGQQRIMIRNSQRENKLLV